MQSIGLALCVLFGFVGNAYAIMCYECNSATNSYCSEAVLPDSLKRNCSEHDRGLTHTLCRKIVQHVDYEVNGHLPSSRVIRSCGWDETRYKGACYHRSGYGGRQEVCSCSSDLCNGTGDLVASYGLLATLLMTFMLK
ncbi:uncharacterized protein [Epargyreus clarus]|uniref:uncharacterized protein n=1 Tax=Epargyreus clarus TaxID=520877 RepID=UPI003C2AF70A